MLGSTQVTTLDLWSVAVFVVMMTSHPEWPWWYILIPLIVQLGILTIAFIVVMAKENK